MQVDLNSLIPKKRVEPPASEIEDKKMFYVRRLGYYGYRCRDEKAFLELAEYFARMALGIWHEKYPDMPRYDLPEKGMFLFGPVGSGKTLALQIFAGIFHIDFVSAEVLAQEYAMRGEAAFWDYAKSFSGRPMVVDDIGNERDLKSFGNEPVICEFIHMREREFRASGVLTHYSSNLEHREELKERYTPQVQSRVLGMCKPIKIKAPDGRLEKVG